MRLSSLLVAFAAITTAACADSAPSTPTGPPLNVNIAALTLQGVGDAIWDIQVKNSASATVFERRITSGQFGDAKGSASYIGTCDAQTGATSDGQGPYADNTVNVWIVGIYNTTPASTGTFGSGALNGASASLPFQNPDLLTQVIKCRENEDTSVQFDVALMRPANQGFFDIAVNFNDIFCSAKFDCSYPTGDPIPALCEFSALAPGHCWAGSPLIDTNVSCLTTADCGSGQICRFETTPGTCQGTTNGPNCDDDTNCSNTIAGQEPIELLFSSTGRSKTMVLGFACTAGTGATVDTLLHMDQIEIDCGGAAFTAPWPSATIIESYPAANGNLCRTAGSKVDGSGRAGCDDGDTWEYITTTGNADDVIYQAAVYQGDEVLGSLNKRYWNIALGITDVDLVECKLRTKATADDGGASVPILAGRVYPYITFQVDLETCTQEPVSFDGSTDVQVRYTTTGTLGNTEFYNYYP